MPIRDSRNYTFRPSGTVDAVDATNGPPGGLTSCQNLVPAPNNPGFFAPRPAALKRIDLTSINATGIISCACVVGTTVYGMIQSSTYPGKDEPFAYNMLTNAILTIAGVSSAALPNTLATAGAWTSPVIFSGASSRIMVLHSGFNGTGNFLGWLDVAGFNSTSGFGNTTTGSPVIRSMHTNVGNSAPILAGYQPGMSVTGAGIPAGTTVLSQVNGTFSLSTTGTTTSGSNSVTAVASATGVEVGMTITGPNLATGTYITALGAGTITLSQNAVASGAASALVVTGGGTVTLSANATATATGVALTVAGGTQGSPQWGSGNFNTNPVTIVPISGNGFNGRAWYGVGPYLVFSDPMNSTQVSLASQALQIGDLTPITAISPLPLTAQLTGGIQQSLTIYKGAESFFQVTGDPTTSNLAVNAVTGSVGTLAPETIAQTPLGVAMVCVDGVRFLGLSGVQSERIGAEGSGVSVPFMNATAPSRMYADFNQNVYRVSVTSATDAAGRPFEYWYDLTTKEWSGPHTFASSIILAYPAGGGFLTAPIGVPATLWFSDVIPKATSSYVENGVQLAWTMETVLLPDNEDMAFNQVIETAVQFASPAANPVQVTAVNERGDLLGSITVKPDFSGATPLWGAVTWGAFNWGIAAGSFRRYPVYWLAPLVFRQAKLRLSASSDRGQVVGDLFVRYQILGYGLDPQP